MACPDIYAMSLHDQCVIAPDLIYGYGQLVLRVHGGWIYLPAIDMKSGRQNVRPGTFVADSTHEELGSTGIYAMSLHDEIELPPDAITGYGFLITAVEGGWIYQLLITNASGLQNARPGCFVPFFAKTQLFFATLTSDNTFTSAEVVTRWNAAAISQNVYTWDDTNGELTFDYAGLYQIDFNISIDQNSGDSRSTAQFWMQLDTGGGFSNVSATDRFIYSRQLSHGEGSAPINWLLNASAADVIRFQIQSVGSATLEYIDASLRVVKLQ